MDTAELAALVTAVGVSLAGIMTAVAALVNANNSKQRMDDLEKANQRLVEENKRLSAENDDKTKHNTYQDAVILDQHRKIEMWHGWGERIGRQLNTMQLAIGAAQQEQKSHKDTRPLTPKPDQDWVTGPLGPLDVGDLHED